MKIGMLAQGWTRVALGSSGTCFLSAPYLSLPGFEDLKIHCKSQAKMRACDMPSKKNYICQVAARSKTVCH